MLCLCMEEREHYTYLYSFLFHDVYVVSIISGYIPTINNTEVII